MQGPFDAQALLAVAEPMTGVETSWEDKISACLIVPCHRVLLAARALRLCLSWLVGNGQSEE